MCPCRGRRLLVDHQDVASEDFRTFHRITFDGKEEGRDRIPHQVVVDVETLILIVGRRTRETGRHPNRIERQGQVMAHRGAV